MGAKQHSAAPAAGGRWLVTAMACALALFGACSLMAPTDEELQAGLGRGDAGDQKDASDGDGGDAGEPDGDTDAGADADAGPDVGGMLPHCNNKEIDPGETDVDCGGLDCLPCSTGGGCLVDSDCEEKVCKGQLCAAPTCTDGVQNQDETDEDCGGATCPLCADEQRCLRNEDCLNGRCRGRICVAASCEDGIQNGMEGGVDCGVSSGCGKLCPVDGECTIDADCDSGVCSGDPALCSAPSCEDNVRNGDETDVDCGGDCDPCGVGDECGGDGDCSSNICEATIYGSGSCGSFNGRAVDECLCEHCNGDELEACADDNNGCPQVFACMADHGCATHGECDTDDRCRTIFTQFNALGNPYAQQAMRLIDCAYAQCTKLCRAP